jgi:hypothetical protein
MDVRDGRLNKDDGGQVIAPKDFHHPYSPYAIQETFMNTVYQVLDEGKIGILESPTGTVSYISRDIEPPPSYQLLFIFILKLSELK